MTLKQQLFLEAAIVDQKSYNTISQEIGVKREILSSWWEELKEDRIYLSNLCKIWKSKFKNQNDWKDSFLKFKGWFDKVPKECHYCKITESEIAQLTKILGHQLTKRKRGRKLEIDRKQPNESYSIIKNLVLSCYWCNNAKTDTFSEEEFKFIGEAIGKVWKNRLSVISST